MNLLTTNNRSLRLAYVAFALVMAILYDVFFWHQKLGLGFLIFILVYAIGFIALTVATKHFNQPLALLLLIPALVLSVDVVLFNNFLVRYIVPFAAIALALVFSIIATVKNPERHRFAFWHIPLFKNIDLPFIQLPAVLRDAFRWGRPERAHIYVKVAWGVVIAIPLLLIFGSLFVMANSAFGDALREIFRFELTSVWRVLRTGVITLFLASILYVLIGEKHTLEGSDFKTIRLDPIIVGTVLALMNALFLMFVVVQLQTINIANDAKSGFFQLAWVIALTAVMMILFYNSETNGKRNSLLKLLKLLLIAQVGVIAYSAVSRMYLFQDLGFSVKRLYVEWFIYFVMAVLALTAIGIITRWPFRRLWYASITLGLITFTVVASVNVDRIVAEENIRRLIQKDKASDIVYLRALSVDAIPAISANYDKLTLPDPSSAAPAEQKGAARYYRRDFNGLLNKYHNELEKYDSWREFNWGVERAKDTPLMRDFPGEREDL